MEMITHEGCLASAEFQVSLSSDILDIDFLASSNVDIQDTLILIDITFPAPDSVNWIVPDGVTILEETNDYAILMFGKTGKIDISMEAFLASCYDIDKKQIEVTDNRTDGASGGRILGNEALVIELKAFPNPARNFINASCILADSMPLDYYIIDLSSNKTILSGSLPADDNHEFTLNLSEFTPGLYALVVVVENEPHVLRLLKS